MRKRANLLALPILILTFWVLFNAGSALSATAMPRFKLPDIMTGELVDSSLERAQPITFVLGDGQVPVGFELGVIGMRLFGRRWSWPISGTARSSSPNTRCRVS